MTYSLGTKSLANLRQVHPKLVAVVKVAITLTKQDFTVHDGARTAAEQNTLYQKGRSRPGPIVTGKDGYKNKSNHQVTPDGTGHAVDLVPWVGKPVWDWDLIYPIALAMTQAARSAQVHIRWGGNWYECLNDYGTSIEAIKEAVERYKVEHPGPDHIDGPHYELLP
jgi:peptidoglycan L-alanyl-D-glutamate endopeptidase CwlK